MTCGGLCPGLNTVVREIFFTLEKRYGVEEIYGIPYGYKGFHSKKLQIRKLTVREQNIMLMHGRISTLSVNSCCTYRKKQLVDTIHYKGGTFLGSSRGGHDTQLITDCIEKYGFRHVYIIGGDGTHRGALKIYGKLFVRSSFHPSGTQSN